MGILRKHGLELAFAIGAVVIICAALILHADRRELTAAVKRDCKVIHTIPASQKMSMIINPVNHTLMPITQYVPEQHIYLCPNDRIYRQ